MEEEKNNQQKLKPKKGRDYLCLLFSSCLVVYVAFDIGRYVVSAISPSHLEEVVVTETESVEVTDPDCQGISLGDYETIYVNKHNGCLDGKGWLSNINLKYLSDETKLKNITFRYSLYGCDHIIDYKTKEN